MFKYLITIYLHINTNSDNRSECRLCRANIGRSIGSTQRKIPGLQTRNGNRPLLRSDLVWRYLRALFVRLKLRSVRQSLIDIQCLELSRCIGQANQVLLANNTRGDQSRAV